MSYKIISSGQFDKELKQLAKKFPSLKKEYEELINEIEKNPFLGTSIGKGCYKIRIAISSKGKGKSGGARVITYVYVQGKTVYLLSIYDKSEKENISDADLKKILSTL